MDASTGVIKLDTGGSKRGDGRWYGVGTGDGVRGLSKGVRRWTNLVHWKTK